MNRKQIILYFLLFLIVLLGIKAVIVIADGCCFINFRNRCYIDTEENCIDETGEFLGEGISCVSHPKCFEGCCCEAIASQFDPYGLRQGTCDENFYGVWLPVDEQDCSIICDVVGPPPSACRPNCEQNFADCVRKGGNILDISEEGGFYCLEKDQAYGNFADCDVACEAIGQCGLGTQIIKDCYCGGEFYSSWSGFCCWDNTYTSDLTGSNCPTGNDCTMHYENGVYYKCCDGCLSDGATYPLGTYDVGTGNTCLEELPICCEQCAPSYMGCCLWDWQCPVEQRSGYNYSSCTGTSCNTGCDRFFCLWDERVNSGVNDPHPMCICSEGYVQSAESLDDYYCTGADTTLCSSKPIETRYCCEPGFLSEEMCNVTNRFNVTGYVFSGDISNKVEGATVKAITTRGIYNATSGPLGEYKINYILIDTGTFDITAVKAGYRPATITEPYPSTPMTLYGKNLNLTLITGWCDSLDPPTVDAFTTNPVKGEKKVNLTWSNPCLDVGEDPSKVEGYYIEKYEGGSLLYSLYTENTFFVDDGTNMGPLEWSTNTLTKTYTYYIWAHYKLGSDSDKTSDSITMGHEHCEGIEKNEEFCLTSGLTKQGLLTLRYTCDDFNYRTQNGISGAINCAPGVCVGPDGNGKTKCMALGNCENKTGRPLGLYYTEDSCIAYLSWCYYDYSFTTIDKCFNCSGIEDCYGYKSEDACLDDNCLISGAYTYAGQNSLCDWFYTFEEFGKGICYDEDYDGTDHCNLCSKDGGLFHNVNCDQSVCTKLGSCYSVDMSCEPCPDNMWCEKYTSEESCVNAHAQGITSRTLLPSFDCPEDIVESDDVCGLGACKWGDPDTDGDFECFKDANDDNKNDCDLNPDIEWACKEDFEPFTTELKTMIPTISLDGFDITFDLSKGDTLGGLEDFYYCIDMDDACCPGISVSVSLNDLEVTVTVDPEAGGMEEVGNYYIRYYSVDGHDNVETVKSTPFFVDPIPPEMVFDYYFYSVGGTIYTVVVAAADEYVECDCDGTDCVPELSSNFVDTNFDEGYNITFFLKYKGVGDGGYNLVTSCHDKAGNSIDIDYEFYVNLIQQITLGNPDGETLNSDLVRFYLISTDDCTCTLEALDASASGIPYNPLPSQPITMNKQMIMVNKLYNYTTNLLDLASDVSYIVKATCVPLYGGRIDKDYFHFTIDTEAPTSSSNAKSGYYKKDPNTGKVTINFNCIDPNINGSPGEAGCEGIYLCEGGPSVCNSRDDYYNGVFISPNDLKYHTDKAITISYFAVDNAGNEEDISDFYYIQIDENVPAVSIIHPTLQFTNQNVVDVDIIASDVPSGIYYVEVRVEEMDDLKRVTKQNATHVGGTMYQWGNAPLFDGLNNIVAIACDYAENCVQDSTQIYYDVYAPEIGEIGIIDGDFDLDVNNIFEHGMNLSFDVTIVDQHIGRKGIGVDNDTVRLTIYDNDNSVVLWKMMKNISNNYYTDILNIIPIGRYNASVGAYDKYGNYADRRVEFEIRDTIPPPLQIIPALPSVVYYPDLIISGITGPLVDVDIEIYDEMGANPIYYPDNIAADAAYPKTGFTNIPLTTSEITGTFPQIGENQVWFNGDYTGILSVTNDYIGFSNDPITRYDITGVFSFMGGFKTRVVVSPNFDHYIDGTFVTASAYTSPEATGYFEVGVVSREGVNNIKVIATEASGNSIYVTDQITYDSVGFSIILANPADGAINYNDFVSAGNKIPLRVRTERQGSSFTTNCKISHKQNDIIATAFLDKPMTTTDNVVHEFMIDSSKCQTNGAYCLIGGTAAYPTNYHHYTVTCSPVGAGMGPKSKDICVGIGTYGGSPPDIYGQNICSSSLTDCGTLVPADCASVGCSSLGQSDCIAEPSCGWCSVSSGCLSNCNNCVSGWVNVGGVCQQPATADCSDAAHNTQSTCIADSVCRWCPTDAPNAGGYAETCLQNNCDNCGDWTGESGGICALPYAGHIWIGHG